MIFGRARVGAWLSGMGHKTYEMESRRLVDWLRFGSKMEDKELRAYKKMRELLEYDSYSVCAYNIRARNMILATMHRY